MRYLSSLKKVKWLLAIFLVQCAVVVFLIVQTGKIQQQAIELNHWVTGQVIRMQDIRAKTYDGSDQSWKEALTVATTLSGELELAYSGNRNLPLNEELLVALKTWHLTVSGMAALLEQPADESLKSKIITMLEPAQREATNVLLSSEKRINQLLNQSANYRFTSIVFTVLLAFSGLAVLIVGRLRSEQKEEEFSSSLKSEANRNEALTHFIEAISSGNYNVELADINDAALTERLRAMRDKLRSAAEEEARRNRTATGLAQIGEILRSTNNSSELYDRIIKFVVNFTQSNQGGLFLHRQDEEGKNQFLDLVAAYAFERKKFINKQIDVGQGLVGQCFLEAERIYLTKVPDDYVHITSGLGEANPNCILLVPLKSDDRVMGVLELASFKNYDENEISLIEKFAQSIAATLATVQINENTRLLLERTQQQAEEMRAQEEEMRQNMEELAATQEEMARKEKEYIKRIQELEEQLQHRTVAR
ncbi:MAG: GAF domain-containing protein [Cyclobacteriaceae bacterium]|nr:GAF domain-containing protein [Cyclobacteriaceae bacterium]